MDDKNAWEKLDLRACGKIIIGKFKDEIDLEKNE
jgi:hypothetical protein